MEVSVTVLYEKLKHLNTHQDLTTFFILENFLQDGNDVLSTQIGVIDYIYHCQGVLHIQFCLPHDDSHMLYGSAVVHKFLLIIINSWKMIQGLVRPEAQPTSRFRDTLLVIAKALYFAHLFISGILAGVLLILEPNLRKPFTLTLALVIIYGFILVWLLLFNFLSVCINKQKWAVWCNRFFAKLIIMMFPILCLIAYSRQHFLNLQWVAVFMIYQMAVSILMIIYQIYACTCGHHEEPRFLYHPNDLVEHTNEVWNRRKEFLKNRANSLPSKPTDARIQQSV